MSFHDVRFPEDISFGSSGGPERLTEIVTLGSGFEDRNNPWAHSRRRYDAGFGVRNLDDISNIVSFFEAREGQLYGFRWKDWCDSKSCLPSKIPSSHDQKIAIGNGREQIFQLLKSYSSGDYSHKRIITRPVKGTVKISIGAIELVEEEQFTVNHSNGEVEIFVAPDKTTPIYAGYEFDVPVRFNMDYVGVNIVSFEAGEIPSIPVIEVLG